MCVDYYLIKKGNLSMEDIFDGTSSSRYWFYRGVNPRAIAVTILSLLPCLPSFAAQIDKKHLGMSLNAQRMFYISFTLTYVIAGVMYFASYLLFPEKTSMANEKTLRFEQLADENDEREREEMAPAMFEDQVEKVDGSDIEKNASKSYVLG